MSQLSCRRTGELVSLELDGELSELESARLESHLEACAACRSLKAELTSMTVALRTAPLEGLERQIALPPRRSRFSLRPLQVGAAAVAVAVAAGLAGALSSVTLHTRSQLPLQQQTRVIVSRGDTRTEGIDAFRAVRRSELTPRVPVGRAGGPASG
ncbi:MAG TPA: zf-HC2 domain-containing protein [Gaiellaceae bacterium]|nr:zf-HC2 domain-containing protein [Gaiellaceae bacterium]